MIRDAFVYFLAFVVPGALGFLTFSTYTHLIDATQYGIYSTSVSISFFIGSSIFGWVRMSLGRHEAATDAQTELRFWLSCFAWSFAALTVVMAVVAFAVPSLRPSLLPLFLLATFQALFELSQESYRSKRQSRTFAFLNFARSALTAAVGILTASLTPDGSYLVLSMATGFGLAAMLGLSLQRGAFRHTSGNLRIKEIFLYGSGIATSGLVFSSISVTSRLVVISMLGPEAAGAYNSAFDLAGQVGGILALSVGSSMGPRLIRTYETEGKVESIAAFAKGLELLVFVLLPALVGLALIARPLATLVTGPAFQDSIALLLPYAVTAVGLAAINNYYLHLVFQITKKPLLQVMAGLVQAACVPLLTYMGIKAASTVGAASGVVAADVVGLVVTYALARAVFPIPIPVKSLAKVAVAAVLMAVIVALALAAVSDPLLQLLVAIPLGAAAYGAACYGLDVMRLRSGRSLSQIRLWLQS